MGSLNDQMESRLTARLAALPNAPTNVIRQILAAGVSLRSQDLPTEGYAVQAAFLNAKLHRTFATSRHHWVIGPVARRHAQDFIQVYDE